MRLMGERVAVHLEQFLVHQIAEPLMKFRMRQIDVLVSAAEFDAAVVDPFDSVQIVPHLGPELAALVDGAVRPLDDEAEHADHALGAVIDAVQIGPVDVDAGTTQPCSDPFEHRAASAVADRYRDAALVGIELFRLEGDAGSVRSGDLLVHRPVLGQSHGSECQDVVGGALFEETGDVLLGPVEILLGGGILHELKSLGLLIGIIEIAGGVLAELEGVKNETAIDGGGIFAARRG